jgi:hypothetical protein
VGIFFIIMALKKTAYTEWLIKTADNLLTEDVGDQRDIISYLIYTGCSQDNNPQSFDIVDEVGDTELNMETFYKAADLVINIHRPENNLN